MSHTFNSFPKTDFQETYRAVRRDGTPMANQPFELLRGGHIVHTGMTDAEGNTQVQKSDFIEGMTIHFRGQRG